MFYDQKNAEGDRTISLSREDIRTARRLLGLLAGVDDSALLDLPSEDGAVSRLQFAARARQEFHNRRRRGQVFGQSMFGEAAWDMLLALYIVDESGRRQTVGSLMRLAGTPMTTAKRWLDFLADHDLVRREPHPTDRRTAFVSLTEKARQKLDMYYSETLKTGV
jgi:DNA-binding MarR family transcriptional regulator